MPKLKDYQIEGVKQIKKYKGRVLLADEPQVGKSPQVIEWLRQNPDIRPAIIICPSIAKYNWLEMAHEFGNLRGAVVEGQKIPKHKPLEKASLIIINYEILAYWVDYLKTLNPKAIITDECHFIKTPSAQRTKALRKLAQDIKYFIPVGATPLKSRPMEMFTVLNILWPKAFPSRFSFGVKYCDAKLINGKWEYKGAKNLDVLHRKLKKLGMIRRLKKDVLKDLKPKKRYVKLLPISNRKEYDEVLNNFIKWLCKTSPSKARKARGAERLVQYNYLRKLAVEGKMKGILKKIDKFHKKHPDKKLILFGIHKKFIKQIKEKYNDNAIVIDGSLNARKKKAVEKLFKRKRKLWLLIANIQSAGMVITLSTAAHYAGFFEIEWTPGDNIQAEDRIWGYGQKEQAKIFYWVAKDTIEHSLCNVNQKKWKTLSAVLDGSKNIKDFNVYDELERMLKKKEKRKEKNG